MDAMRWLLCVCMVVSSVYCHSHDSQERDEEEDCERRTAGSDYIDMIMSHGTYMNKSLQYPNNYKKCWTITSELGGRVQLTINSFQLQPRVNGECMDWLRITEGSHSTFYCGTMNQTVIESIGNDMTLTFQTDGSVGGAGFLGEFYAIDWQYPMEPRRHLHTAAIAVVLIVVVLAAVIFACNVAVFVMCKKYKYKKRQQTQPIIEPSEKYLPPDSEFPQVVIGPLPVKHF